MTSSSIDPIARDTALLARMREDDEAAFQALFEQYFVPLTRYAAAVIGRPERAVEVVHDILLVIWGRRKDIEIQTAFSTYLYSAVRNAALNARRREGLAVHVEAPGVKPLGHEDSVSGMSVEPFDALSAASFAERAELLSIALDRLALGRREIILLRWAGGLNYAEIAEVMGVSTRTAEMTHAWAIEDLRILLGDRFP